MRFPIFQLSWHHKEGSLGLGLVFASELPYETQNFGFFVPILTTPELIKGKSQPYNFVGLYDYYFPCEIDGKYFELNGQLIYTDAQPILSFSFNEEYTFTFNFVITPMSSPHVTLGINSLLNYVGKERKYNFSKLSFLEIYPSDIQQLNNFFTIGKGIFVGYTNHFGRYLADNISGG